MKTDVRIVKTRKKLSDALLNMLEIMPKDDITVLSLCQAAGVSRATFYKHYKNCQDVLVQLEDEILSSFIDLLGEQESVNIPSVMRLIRLQLSSYPEYNRIMIHSRRNLYLVHQMIAAAKPQNLKRLKIRFPQLSKKELDMLYTLLSYGIFSVGLYCDERYGPDQVDAFIKKIINIYAEALDRDKPALPESTGN